MNTERSRNILDKAENEIQDTNQPAEEANLIPKALGLSYSFLHFLHSTYRSNRQFMLQFSFQIAYTLNKALTYHFNLKV